MTTALQKMSTEPAVLSLYSLSREQIQILKDTVAKGATDAELGFFLQVCKAKGLDPFSGQIHAMKRRTKNRQTGEWEERLTWQTGIDGFRTQAERTGERDGMDPPEWCGEDGAWLDVWLKREPPRACRVRVYRKGIARPYQGTANWDFYVQTWKDQKGNQQPNEIWAKGGPHMLAKCAEALALRIAFPLELGDLYTHEEMAGAGASVDAAAVPFTAPPSVGQILDVAPAALPPHHGQTLDEVLGEEAPSGRAPVDPKDLAATLLAARNDADLVAIVVEISALPESPEKQQLRELYGEVKRKIVKGKKAPAQDATPPAERYDGPPEDVEPAGGAA